MVDLIKERLEKVLKEQKDESMSDDYRFIKKMVAMELEHILKCNEINKLIEEEKEVQKKYKKNESL